MPLYYSDPALVDKESGNPLSKVYIKVYARSGKGKADGYTDLRSRFDYIYLTQLRSAGFSESLCGSYLEREARGFGAGGWGASAVKGGLRSFFDFLLGVSTNFLGTQGN